MLKSEYKNSKEVFPIENLIRVKEFCQDVGVSKQTLTKWMKEGMPHLKVVSGIVFIDQDKATEWVQQHKRNEDHLTFKEAAAIANVHWETLRYWRKADSSFMDVMIQSNKQRCISRQRFIAWMEQKFTKLQPMKQQKI